MAAKSSEPTKTIDFSELHTIESTQDISISIRNKNRQGSKNIRIGAFSLNQNPTKQMLVDLVQEILPMNIVAKLQLCTSVESLYLGCKVIVMLYCKSSHSRLSRNKGYVPSYNSFFMPFTCVRLNGDSIDLRVEIDINIYKNSSYSQLCNTGDIFTATRKQLLPYINNNKIYCSNRDEITALGAVAPSSRNKLNTGPRRGELFPVSANTTTRSGRSFSNMLGFASNFLPQAPQVLSPTVSIPKAPQILAPEVSVHIMDKTIQQLKEYQDAYDPTLYNKTTNEIGTILQSNSTIKFIIRKGSDSTCHVIEYVKPDGHRAKAQIKMNDLRTLTQIFNHDPDLLTFLNTHVYPSIIVGSTAAKGGRYYKKSKRSNRSKCSTHTKRAKYATHTRRTRRSRK